MKILLDPLSTDGGSVTPPAPVVSTSASSTPTPQATPQKRSPDDVRTVKFEQPKDPPKEVLEMQFSDEDGPKTNELVKETKKDEDNNRPDKSNLDKVDGSKKSDEGKEVKVKVEDKTDNTPTLPSYIKPPKGKEGDKKEDKSAEAQEVDYSKFAPTEVGYLKNMSKEARVFAAELITKNKDLEKVSKGLYLQHPQAYTLSPQYVEAQQTVTFAQKEAAIWNECLAACKLGKPFKPIVGWDKDGNAVRGAEVQSTDGIEEEVRANMNKCRETAHTIGENMKVYAANHVKGINNDLGVICAEQKSRFAWHRDAKFLDYTIAVKDAKGVEGDKSIKQIRTEFKSLFPAYLGNDPGVDVAADLMVDIIIKDAEINELRKQLSVSSIKKAEQEHIEPSAENRPGKQPDLVGGVREFSAGDMPT